ncbi:MAG: Hint domain-containing protein [Pseudomonadota bacterium]
MASVFSNLIYIGNFADMDTDESNQSNEEEFVAGTYTAADMSLHTIEFDDQNGDGVIWDDEAYDSDDDDDDDPPGELAYYDVGNGPQAQLADSTSDYTATITLADGSSFVTHVAVIQMQNGDVFLGEPQSYSGSLDNIDIRSIRLEPSPDTDFAGFYASNSMSNTSVVCFTRHTLVQTPDGPVNIARLRVGDLVETLDQGPRPVAWVGGQFHALPGIHAPIRISPGALGDGQPERALLVSPQHRILLRNKVAARMFGNPEVLVAAKALLPLPGVCQMPPTQSLTYWHLAFDAHEVIRANGAWAEALYPGPMACHALPEVALEELRVLMPGFGLSGVQMPLARPSPPMRQQTRLLQRVIQNKHVPVAPPPA